MKSDRAIRELAADHGLRLTKRVFLDCRDDDGSRSTRFLDVPRPRAELVDELRDAGVLPEA